MRSLSINVSIECFPAMNEMKLEEINMRSLSKNDKKDSQQNVENKG